MATAASAHARHGLCDVLVVGGGHAACEAALAAARLGARTLLLSINLDHIALMSCNPAVGGVAKGHVVREIDALGGSMAAVADAAAIQSRMLNRGKGPAVWSPRSQCDKACYQRAMKALLEDTPGILLRQGIAEEFILDSKGRPVGVRTDIGEEFRSAAIVLATGTFLSGKLHYGLLSKPGGRAGDPPSIALARALRSQLGLRLGRLKTGTPPRLLGRTIDFSRMEPQESEPDVRFSFFDATPPAPRASRRDHTCWLTRTTPETAAIVRENLPLAPMYAGRIEGVGTRYCPSFEDKVVRFPGRGSHQLFIEPEGEHTGEYYVNGLATSLPPDVQRLMLATIPGLERAVPTRHAYAIEYDFIFPDQMLPSLALKAHPNVFPAGQINGTSGYEEAAGQGLVAGLNAARLAQGLDPVVLPRSDSFIGVMLDDLATKDIVEPYRLFTSRSERRLSVRQDNADLRLCPLAIRLGLLPHAKREAFEAYAARLASAAARLAEPGPQAARLRSLIRSLEGVIPASLPFDPAVVGLDAASRIDRRALEQLAILAHYEPYIQREDADAARLRDAEAVRLPPGLDFSLVPGLGAEARMKLLKVAPATLGQAMRIDGVTPADIAALRIHIRRSSPP